MIDKSNVAWKNMSTYVSTQSTSQSSKIVNTMNFEFDYKRSRLLDSIGKSTEAILKTYDKDEESKRLSRDVLNAVLQTAAVEVGAIGVGAILGATLLDVSGILSASALAVAGLAVLPYQKYQIKSRVKAKLVDLRTQLKNVLQRHFESEMNHSVQKMKDTISPYSLFVRVEETKLTAITKEFEESRKKIAALAQVIDKNFKD